ncbi:MAG: SAM-dependent methyltransferase [Chlamydia sp.]
MPLYLLPNVFSDEQPIENLLPTGLQDICESLDGCIAESERSARRYLLKVNRGSTKMRTLPIYLLNEHSSLHDMMQIETRILHNESLGLVSDAGLPCIADPGSHLVLRLREKSYSMIEAIPGPSSIFLALMLSGLSGQRFAFHGYLPKEESVRQIALRKMEQSSFEKAETQIWIETPYRNRAMYQSVVETLQGKTLFSMATQLTFPDQRVETLSIERWKKKEIREDLIPSFPTVFLMQSMKK